MNTQKGFTIIELIVVIAIIAVLAAIVMVNVTTYISKGRDAAIKADLEGAFTIAQAVYADTGAYVVDSCTSAGDFKTAYDAAAAISGAESCADSTTAWCACAQERADTTKYYCVDSAGNKEESAVACSTDCVDGTDYICDGL